MNLSLISLFFPKQFVGNLLAPEITFNSEVSLQNNTTAYCCGKKKKNIKRNFEWQKLSEKLIQKSKSSCYFNISVFENKVLS